MLDPIIKTIEVPCNQKMAFEVFLNEMGSWWPLGKFTVSAMGGTPAKTIRIDAKEGGQIMEIGPNDEEHLWGTIKTYNPYDFVSMDFQITPPGHPVGSWTLIQVTFTVLDENRTQVVLNQSNWEVFGEMAAGIHHGYSIGWTSIFEEGYKAACGG